MMYGVSQFAYIVASALLHLRAALDEHARDRAARASTPAWRHGDRDARHLGRAGGHSSRVDRRWRSSRASLVGVPLSRVPLTAVPQRTALSHAFGGLAAGLVGTAEYYLRLSEAPGT